MLDIANVYRNQHTAMSTETFEFSYSLFFFVCYWLLAAHYPHQLAGE